MITRRFHPRGTERVLRKLHPPDGGTWSIHDTVALEGRFETRLQVDTGNWVEWRVFFLGSYEPEVAQVLRQFVRPGTLAIDVGANVGIHTVTLASALRDGRVIAFEPNPVVRERLIANLKINGLTNVEVRSIALGAQTGTAVLHTASLSNLTSTLIGIPDQARVVVEVAPLDDVLRDNSPVSVIKVDVDGFDPAVLVGAERTVRQHRPVLVFEYQRELWGQAGYSLDFIQDWLNQCGYRSLHRITPSGMRPIGPSPANFMELVARP